MLFSYISLSSTNQFVVGTYVKTRPNLKYKRIQRTINTISKFYITLNTNVILKCTTFLDDQ